MNNTTLTAFLVLLKREMWEHKKLFVAAPLVLTLLLVVATTWAATQIPGDMVVELLGQLSAATAGVDASALAPLLMSIAIPYMLILFFCTFIYLINALYQDRKDSSILFWQSMPVSNLQTVLSKVFTVCFIAPLFVVAAMFVLFLVIITVILILGVSYNVELASLGQMILASIYSLLLIYMTAVLAALWLFPTAGWLLMFSAFSRNLPFLWAIGAFILLLFFEDFIFGTQFLATWLESRTASYSYIIFEAGDFFQRLFNYDMLFGIILGSLLITGAAYMRRFSE